MQIIEESALKNARMLKKMSIEKAAQLLNISESKLYMYEREKTKTKDEKLHLDAMRVYGDIRIGISYLNDDLVFRYLFGNINLTDELWAAAKFASFDETETKQQLLSMALDGNTDSLLDTLVRRLKSYMDTAINIYLNLRQKNGFIH